MIRLTRLNNQPVVINAQVVAYIETNPDTMVTLLNGERIYVRESPDEIVGLATTFLRRIASGALHILATTKE